MLAVGSPQQLLGSWTGEHSSATESSLDLARKPCQFTVTQNEPLRNEDGLTPRLRLLSYPRGEPCRPLAPSADSRGKAPVVRRLGPGAGPGQDQWGGLWCVPAPSSPCSGDQLQPQTSRVPGSSDPDGLWETAPLSPTPGPARTSGLCGPPRKEPP